jgi:hypothetical protein
MERRLKNLLDVAKEKNRRRMKLGIRRCKGGCESILRKAETCYLMIDKMGIYGDY